MNLAESRRQLAALVGLRWQMVRDSRVRLGLIALALVLPVAAIATALVVRSLPEAQRFDFALVTPTIFLGFAVLSIASPLANGGGSELYPADQLVAYPVRPETQFLGGIATMPLNLAWASQLVVLTAGATLLSEPRWLPLPVLTELAFVALVTVIGQALGWIIVGVRQSRRGRQVVVGLSAGFAIIGYLVVRSAGLTGLLDRSPTRPVVLALTAGGAGRPADWVPMTLGLVVGAAVMLPLGARCCAWAMRQPGDAGVFRESRRLRRRSARRSDLAELVAMDRASIWRSTALRRGLIVLAFLPGSLALALDADWRAIPILPGLVAAGAGLLFGVNAFSLDGSGAVWLATLPHDPRLLIRSKARVILETCMVVVVLAVATALVAVDRPPTAGELSALLSVTVATILTVVATCAWLSVTKPHRADLRGARDTPAPPGTMAVYSVRLSVATTFTALIVGGSGVAGPWIPPVLALPVVLLAVRRLLAAGRLWSNPHRRAFVVSTVAAG